MAPEPVHCPGAHVYTAQGKAHRLLMVPQRPRQVLSVCKVGVAEHSSPGVFRTSLRFFSVRSAGLRALDRWWLIRLRNAPGEGVFLATSASCSSQGLLKTHLRPLLWWKPPPPETGTVQSQRELHSLDPSVRL